MKPNRESGEGLAAARPTEDLAQALLNPLRDLQTQYLGARETIDRVLGALADTLEVGVAARGREPEPGPDDRPDVMQLDVRFPSMGALLDFQQRVLTMEGVVSVTVAGSRGDRSTLLVELRDESAIPEPASEAEAPTIVCAECGRVLFEGSDQISHGLCPDCTSRFLSRS